MFEIAAVGRSLEAKILQKFHSLELTPQLKNRLPTDVFVRIPASSHKRKNGTRGLLHHEQTSDHHDACLSIGRKMLPYTSSFWTGRFHHVDELSTDDFPPPIRKPAPVLYRALKDRDHTESSITLNDPSRLQGPSIFSRPFPPTHFERLIENFSVTAPGPKHLKI